MQERSKKYFEIKKLSPDLQKLIKVYNAVARMLNRGNKRKQYNPYANYWKYTEHIKNEMNDIKL